MFESIVKAVVVIVVANVIVNKVIYKRDDPILNWLRKGLDKLQPSTGAEYKSNR